nr:MAG TPA: hypothetical protein [Caudoviricetes sp.]
MQRDALIEHKQSWSSERRAKLLLLPVSLCRLARK